MPIPKPQNEEVRSAPSALRHIRDYSFLQTEKYQEQQWRADDVEAHPEILEFKKAFIKKMRNLGVPMFASEVWRSDQRQDMLFVTGRSNATAGKSPHQFGCAVDIIHSTHGWEIPHESWQIIGHLGKELAIQQGIKIQWGGDWSTLYDPAHWQLKNWKEKKIIR